VTGAAPARPHTDALMAALGDAGILVGRGKKPDGAGWQGEPGESEFRSYGVLYPGAGTTDGDLCDPHEYLDYSCQITTVGATQDGAEAVMDMAKTLVGRRLDVDGRSAWPAYIDSDRPATRDDTVSPPVHYAVAVFRFRSGPA
jgi:hypothetical protein